MASFCNCATLAGLPPVRRRFRWIVFHWGAGAIVECSITLPHPCAPLTSRDPSVVRPTHVRVTPKKDGLHLHMYTGVPCSLTPHLHINPNKICLIRWFLMIGLILGAQWWWRDPSVGVTEDGKKKVNKKGEEGERRIKKRGRGGWRKRVTSAPLSGCFRWVDWTPIWRVPYAAVTSSTPPPSPSACTRVSLSYAN